MKLFSVLYMVRGYQDYVLVSAPSREQALAIFTARSKGWGCGRVKSVSEVPT